MNIGDFVVGIIVLLLSALILVEGSYHFVSGTPVIFDADYRFKITAGWIFIILSVPLLAKLKENKK
jgi:hypothetical protein